MKTLNSYLFLTILFSTISIATSTTILDSKIDNVVSCNIESYLSTLSISLESETVTIFSDFLIKENNDIYTIDFMVTEKGEIIVLTKNFEKEYFKMDSYSTKNLKTHSFAVATVSGINYKV